MPEVPYYAEGELVRERVVTETVEDVPPAVVQDGNGWLWLLLLPLVLLLVLGAYLVGRDDDDDAGVVQTPVNQPSVVVTQAPVAPPVVVNPPPVVVNPPPVVVTQAPAPEQSVAQESAVPAPS
ncbi:MAG: hypothetical protein LC789_03555 [Actinobacteria bacterium]|nr:hypothetical protein [Actinomycetota bacterium]MCA1722412.1 hypothetical protein [Actinomycetota bacterium]